MVGYAPDLHFNSNLTEYLLLSNFRKCGVTGYSLNGGLPDWTLKLVLVLLAIGLIVSVILSWIYDIKPEGGLKKTKPSQKVKEDAKPATSSTWKIILFLIIYYVRYLFLK